LKRKNIVTNLIVSILLIINFYCHAASEHPLVELLQSSFSVNELRSSKPLDKEKVYFFYIDCIKLDEKVAGIKKCGDLSNEWVHSNEFPTSIEELTLINDHYGTIAGLDIAFAWDKEGQCFLDTGSIPSRDSLDHFKLTHNAMSNKYPQFFRGNAISACRKQWDYNPEYIQTIYDRLTIPEGRLDFANRLGMEDNEKFCGLVAANIIMFNTYEIRRNRGENPFCSR
jgi:hypothetical protein